MADPAALRFTLALPGLQSLSVGLSRLRTDIADWTTFWRERFAPGFYRAILEDFVNEGGSSGARWAPLSAAYAKWKMSRFPNNGILVASGQMKASLGGPEAPLAVFRPGPTSLEIGTSVPYAFYHQVGTSRMPQRPPIRMSAAFMTQVGKNLQAFVQDAWKERRQQFVADVQAGLRERVS